MREGWTDRPLFIEPFSPWQGVQKIKDKSSWTYVIEDLNDKEITGIFYKQELQKTN